MKKVLKWVLIIFVVLIVIGVVAGKDEGSESSTNNSPQDSKAEVTTPVKENAKAGDLKFSENEMIALKSLISDDVKINFNGKDSLFDYGYLYVTAKEMFKTYSANEARGDKLYKDKKLIISGTIESISSSIGDIPIVNLKTGDMFRTVSVNFTRKYRDIAADLDKNQSVSFACVGGTVVIGAPSVKDCVPIDVAIDQATGDKVKDIVKLLRNPKSIDDNNLMAIVIMTKAISNASDDFKTCKPDDIKCIEVISKNIQKEKDGGKESFSKAAQDLGIELPNNK